MKRLLILILALLVCKANAFAFNLWEDVQQNTQWTLGENASVGTAYDVVKDQIDVSELAQIASYRFLSAWYGGIQVPQADNTVKWTDAGKIGLNLNYFLAGFAHRPPEVLQRIVIGPAYAMPIFVKPHRGTLFIDVNYVFGSLGTVPSKVPPPTLAPPSTASKLNLFHAPLAG
jgi:hypothetical protein